MTRTAASLAFVLGGLCVTLLGADSASVSPNPASDSTRTSRDPVDSALWTDMHNVNLRVGAEGSAAVMHVRTLRGRVIPTTPGAIPFLDDAASFRIAVTSGAVALDGVAMTTLMNERVFNYRGAPIRRLRITFENGQVVQSGVMHKGVDLSFKMWGDLSLTPDGF